MGCFCLLFLIHEGGMIRHGVSFWMICLHMTHLKTRMLRSLYQKISYLPTKKASVVIQNKNQPLFLGRVEGTFDLINFLLFKVSFGAQSQHISQFPCPSHHASSFTLLLSGRISPEDACRSNSDW
jgi:hypothetical protein